MPLLDRLRLAKDLALEGAAALVPSATDATAIRGIVQLDLAFDIAGRTACDHVGRVPADDKFPALLVALQPELGPLTSAIRDLHRLRNLAQHGGVAPPAVARQQLRRDGEEGLSVAFALAGQNFRDFSSVPQLSSRHFRDPLEEALNIAKVAPADAMALVARAFGRAKGWAEQILGDAAIPDEMWVFDTERWNDVQWTVACADKRDEFLAATLRVAAASVLKVSVPDWIRLNLLGWGRKVVWQDGCRSFDHHVDAERVTEEDVAWATEVVARSILALEQEWPGFHLVAEARHGNGAVQASMAEAVAPDSSVNERVGTV